MSNEFARAFATFHLSRGSRGSRLKFPLCFLPPSAVAAPAPAASSGLPRRTGRDLGVKKLSRITFHVSRFTHHVSRITFHASRFTHHVSRITFHASRFTFHAS